MRATIFHYLAIGILIAVSFYMAENAISPMRHFDVSAHYGKAHLAALSFSDNARLAFDKINKINFLSYFGLCASAIFIYLKTPEKQGAAWLFVINVLAHFIVLCVAYFWLGDTLFVFQKAHDLWEGGFSASLIIVPLKLLFAVIFAVVCLQLARSLAGAKEKQSKEKQLES